MVTHTVTLGYVEPGERDAFRALLSRRGAHRLGAEGQGVLPDLDEQTPGDIAGQFVVDLDDHVLAFAHPHGRTLTWQ